jgi:hypothetical protein
MNSERSVRVALEELGGVVSRTPHAASDVDPDYVLLMIRFHIAVFHHNSDECDVDACDYCSWDNYDTYSLLVHFVEKLDDWMIADGRAPRVWASPRPTGDRRYPSRQCRRASSNSTM